MLDEEVGAVVELEEAVEKEGGSVFLAEGEFVSGEIEGGGFSELGGFDFDVAIAAVVSNSEN